MKITDTHVYFFTDKDIYSNWFKSQFFEEIDGAHFFNTEQAFMYFKSKFFNDLETCLLIYNEANPKLVKELGHKIKNYNDKAWSCVRYGYMVYVNYLKFSQNFILEEQLILTGNKILVEASPYDKIWGVGLGEDDPRIIYPEQWLGKNLLGKALMDVREMIKND